MAIFKVPGQNYEVELPDEGQVFRGVQGNGQNQAFVRKGNAFYTIPKEQYQGNFESLQQINPSSEGINLAMSFGGLKLQQGNPNDFINQTPTTGEVLTLAPRADNPQSGIVTSSTRGMINPGISTQEQAAHLGTTPSALQAQQSTLLPSGTYAPGIPKQEGPITASQGPMQAQPNRPAAQGTLRQFGLQSDATIGSPEATQFLLAMKPSGQQGISPVVTPQAGGMGVNTTPTGQVMNSVFGTANVKDALSYLETLVSSPFSSSISKEQGESDVAKSNLEKALASRPSLQGVFEGEAERRGIKPKQDLITELDRFILEQKQEIREFPDALKNRLSGVGVTAAQLERLTNVELKPKAEVFRDLLEQRNVLASEIDRTMNFINQFTDKAARDYATDLEGLRMVYELEEGDVAKLSQKQKEAVKQSIDLRKDLLSLSAEVAKAGGDKDTVKRILDSGSMEDAMIIATPLLNQGQAWSAPYLLGGDYVQKNTQTGEVRTAVNVNTTTDTKDIKLTARVSPIASAINSIRGGDGFVDPKAYKELYQAYLQQNPGYGEEFLKNFPIEVYINPAERYIFSK